MCFVSALLNTADKIWIPKATSQQQKTHLEIWSSCSQFTCSIIAQETPCCPVLTSGTRQQELLSATKWNGIFPWLREKFPFGCNKLQSAKNFVNIFLENGAFYFKNLYALFSSYLRILFTVFAHYFYWPDGGGIRKKLLILKGELLRCNYALHRRGQTDIVPLSPCDPQTIRCSLNLYYAQHRRFLFYFFVSTMVKYKNIILYYVISVRINTSIKYTY